MCVELFVVVNEINSNENIIKLKFELNENVLIECINDGNRKECNIKNVNSFKHYLIHNDKKYKIILKKIKK